MGRACACAPCGVAPTPTPGARRDLPSLGALRGTVDSRTPDRVAPIEAPDSDPAGPATGEVRGVASVSDSPTANRPIAPRTHSR